MSAEHLLDTRIFVCLFDGATPQKRHRARELVAQSLANGSGCVSYQVVQETVNVLTGKLGTPPAGVRRLVDDVLSPLVAGQPHSSPVPQRYLPTEPLQILFLRFPHLVAAALEAGCTRLYSEDLQHDQHIQHLTITNPLLSQ